VAFQRYIAPEKSVKYGFGPVKLILDKMYAILGSRGVHELGEVCKLIQAQIDSYEPTKEELVCGRYILAKGILSEKIDKLYSEK
jgi:hypothetical protein